MSELRKENLLMLGLPFARSYKFQGSKAEIRKKKRMNEANRKWWDMDKATEEAEKEFNEKQEKKLKNC